MTGRLLGAIVFCLCVGATGLAAPPDERVGKGSVKGEWGLGRACMQRGEYEEAIIHLERYVAEYPEGTQGLKAFVMLATAYAEIGDLAGGEDALERLGLHHLTEPSNANSPLWDAWTCLVARDVNCCIEECFEVIEGTNENMKVNQEAKVILGIAYFSADRFDEAQLVLRDVLSIAEDRHVSAFSRYLLGHCLIVLGEIVEGEEFIRASEAVSDYDTLTFVGDFTERMVANGRQVAKDLWEQDALGGHLTGYLEGLRRKGLGDGYYQAGNYQEARTEYLRGAQASRIAAVQHSLWERAILCSERLGQAPEETVAEAVDVVLTKPNTSASEECIRSLGKYAKKNDKAGELAAFLDMKTAGMIPGEGRAFGRYAKGQVREACEDFGLALAAYEEVLSQDPGTKAAVWSLYGKGRIHERRMEWQPMLVAYRTAVGSAEEYHPSERGKSHAAKRIASYYAKRGDTERAAAWWKYLINPEQNADPTEQ